MLIKVQDMPQGQALSVEPILANEHILVASPQAKSAFGRPSVVPFLRLVSEVTVACDSGCSITLTSPALVYKCSMLSVSFTVLIKSL